jgi:hypothetical protein
LQVRPQHRRHVRRVDGGQRALVAPTRAFAPSHELFQARNPALSAP